MWGGVECTIERVEDRFPTQPDRSGHVDHDDELERARDAGVLVPGACLCPAFDRPDWNGEWHWHNSGLWDVAQSSQSSGHADVETVTTMQPPLLTDPAPREVAYGAIAELQLFRLARRRLPAHQALLDAADGAVEGEREDGEHEDAGHHGVDVERAFGLQDQVADAA
jgi:hypothetical protein